MRVAFKEKPYDLLAVVALALAILPFIAFSILEPIRIGLGLLFVLFLPGYALIAALFPKDKEIDWIERTALSFGLSIAVVPLLGLLLNYTPWGIRLEPIVATVLLFTLGMCGIAYYRRMQTPVEDRLSISIELKSPAWKEYSLLDKVLTIALIASIIIAAGALAYVLIEPREGEKFTEFYILDENGMAQDYPTQLNVSEQGTVIMGIVNHEYATVNYTVKTVLITVQFVYNSTTQRNDTIEIANLTLDTRYALLEHEKTWEEFFNFSISQSGDYKLRFLLFKDSLQSESYRDLHLWINVN